MTDTNVTAVKGKRGRKAKVLDDAFFADVAAKVKAGAVTAEQMGISDRYVRQAVDKGILVRVKGEKAPGRGRRPLIYALAA